MPLFKNHKLQVSLIKDPNNANAVIDSIPVTDITESAKQVVTLISEKLIFGIAIYIGMDTLRKVIVKGARNG